MPDALQVLPYSELVTIQLIFNCMISLYIPYNAIVFPKGHRFEPWNQSLTNSAFSG